MRKLIIDDGIVLDYTDAIGAACRTDGKDRCMDILFPTYVYTLRLSGQKGADAVSRIYPEVKEYVKAKSCSENKTIEMLTSELDSLKTINRNQNTLIESLNAELDRTEDALLES